MAKNLFFTTSLPITAQNEHFTYTHFRSEDTQAIYVDRKMMEVQGGGYTLVLLPNPVVIVELDFHSV